MKSIWRLADFVLVRKRVLFGVISCIFVGLYSLLDGFWNQVSSPSLASLYRVGAAMNWGEKKGVDEAVIVYVDGTDIGNGESEIRTRFRKRLARVITNIQNSGSILVVLDIDFSESTSADAELFESINGAWSATPAMPVVFSSQLENGDAGTREVGEGDLMRVERVKGTTEVLDRQLDVGGRIPRGVNSLEIVGSRGEVMHPLSHTEHKQLFEVAALTKRNPEQRDWEGPADKEYNNHWINFYGFGKPIKSKRFSDLVDSSMGDSELKGKYVFIGGVPEIPGENFPVAAGRELSGVEIHAYMTLNAIKSHWIQVVSNWCEVIVIVVCGVFVGSVASRFRFVEAFIVFAVLELILLVSVVGLFIVQNLWFPYLAVAKFQVGFGLLFSLLPAKTIFLSYSNPGGRVPAKNYSSELRRLGVFRCYTDWSATYDTGRTEDVLKSEIARNRSLMLVVSPETFQPIRIKGPLGAPVYKKNWQRREYDHAVKCGLNCIPVFSQNNIRMAPANCHLVPSRADAFAHYRVVTDGRSAQEVALDVLTKMRFSFRLSSYSCADWKHFLNFPDRK